MRTKCGLRGSGCGSSPCSCRAAFGCSVVWSPPEGVVARPPQPAARIAESVIAARLGALADDDRPLHIVVDRADVLVSARARERQLVALDQRRWVRVDEDAGVVKAPPVPARARDDDEVDR